MKYLLTGVIVVLFSLIYMIGYKLNSKVEIKCEKPSCSGCGFNDCIHRKEEE